LCTDVILQLRHARCRRRAAQLLHCALQRRRCPFQRSVKS